MAYPEVLIPPSVQPESPVDIEPVDDQTVVFSPQFARGLSQRQTWGDPLWGMRLRYKGLSQSDRALLKSAIAASRGKGANIRVTPGLPLRGSFPATEAFANNNFASGTTGWTAARCTLSAADRVLRLTNTKSAGVASFDVFQQNLSVTQYAPYALRSFIASVSRAGMSNGTFVDVSNYGVDRAGLVTQASVQLSATTSAVYPGSFDATGVVSLAGDYGELGWTSYARCALVDNGPNALTRSDEIDNAAWTKNAATITTGISAPDGTTTAVRLTETAATSNHYALQSVTVPAAAADYCFSIAVKVGAIRGWCCVQVNEDTASSAMSVYVNLTTGALGTVSTGANWGNVRAFTVDLGNGWFRISLVGRKTNAATSLSALILSATADGASTSFAGNTGAYLHLWRAVFAQSSVPVKFTQTTATATTGTTQTSNRLYVKGLPASTSGLLLAGDFVEINGELERVVAPLNSDAAGLGVLILGRRRAVAPADNAPIIVLNPMGRFIIQAVRETERYGLYTDVEIDLIEAPA